MSLPEFIIAFIIAIFLYFKKYRSENPLYIIPIWVFTLMMLFLLEVSLSLFLPIILPSTMLVGLFISLGGSPTYLLIPFFVGMGICALLFRFFDSNWKSLVISIVLLILVVPLAGVILACEDTDVECNKIYAVFIAFSTTAYITGAFLTSAYYWWKKKK